MADVISEKDPRGVKVFCTESQWENHIVNNDTGHPQMRDNVDAIIQTIQSPDFIFESHDSDPPRDYREVYSKEVKSATYYSAKTPYTKVIVSTVGGSAEIITAYPAKNPTGGTKGEAIYGGNDET